MRDKQASGSAKRDPVSKATNLCTGDQDCKHVCQPAGGGTPPRDATKEWFHDSVASPRPWRIDKDNSDGIEIVADNGHLVAIENWGDLPSERGPGFAEQVIDESRANHYLIVECVNRLAGAALQGAHGATPSAPPAGGAQKMSPEFRQWFRLACMDSIADRIVVMSPKMFNEFCGLIRAAAPPAPGERKA